MLNVALDTHLGDFHLTVDFTAGEGKTTVLLGESGAGKSTVLRLLAGLLHPEHGSIALNGTTYLDSEQKIFVPPQARPFGYVFQDYILFPHLSVFENVAFGLRAQRLPRSLIQQRVGEALERVHLRGFDTRRPGELSGGQQQRVAIARALALQPRLLLLDEPLAALDVQTRRAVRQELHRLLTEIEITTVLVTHHYLEALLLGDHILVLDHGTVIQQGGQRELLEYPRSSYVAELIGVNFFQGRVIRYEPDMICVVRLPIGDQLFEIAATLKEHIQGETSVPVVGEHACIVVHPRNITLYQAPPASSARNVFQGEILQVLRLRSGGKNADEGHVRVSIVLNASLPPLTAEITEASAARMGIQEGQTIYAAFKAIEAQAYL
jgi:molybdate transport system ATP-binding protein